MMVEESASADNCCNGTKPRNLSAAESVTLSTYLMQTDICSQQLLSRASSMKTLKHQLQHQEFLSIFTVTVALLSESHLVNPWMCMLH